MTTDRTPDPVDDPTGYQRLILSLLGEDDPAQVQAETLDAVRALPAAAGERVAVRPEPAEWSVLECLGHMLDAEIVVSARYRWVIAQERPRLLGYDQDAWVERLRHAEDDPEAVVALHGALRRANLDLWSRSSAEERARAGVHDERGVESYGLIFRLTAGHDRFHLDQARRALAAVTA